VVLNWTAGRSQHEVGADLAGNRLGRQNRGMYTVDAGDAVLEEVVRRLVNAVNPDRIYLFGSRARGDHAPDSDVDLLIVRDSTEPRHRRAIPAYRALRGMAVPKDLLWFTPQEVAEWRGVTNHVLHQALREGRLLYEKRY